MRQILKALLKTGAGSGVCIALGIVSMKVLAARNGAAALGTFSLSRQMILIGSSLFLTGGQTALVQGLASRTNVERTRFSITAFLILGVGSFSVGALGIIFAPWIAQLIFPGQGAADGIWVAGLAIAVSGPLAFTFGAMNGFRMIGHLAIAQVLNAAALAGLILFVFGGMRSVTPISAALVVGLSQLPGLIFGLAILLRRRTISLSLNWDSQAAKGFIRLGASTIIAAGLQAWTVMFLRAGAARTGGVTLAGLFDAGWTISMVYVMLLLSSFSTYFLPTLAAAEDRNRVITDVLRVTLLIAVPMVSGMIALRPFVLVLLYSPQFLPVTRMMNWMLIGDALKVISFVLAMPMLALADTKAYLTGEVLWNLLMIIGATLAYSGGGSLEHIGLVFAGSYCAYLMYSLRYCRVRLGWKLPGSLTIPVITAALTVLLVSYSAWDCGEIHLTPISIALAGSSAVALLIVRRRESVSSTGPFLPEANG